MKIVIAPDSFKESLSAAEVAGAIASGLRQVCPDAEIDLCPMADGGEGTVDAMVAATGGEVRRVEVFDPLGEQITAGFGLLGDGSTAVIEMAAASGLPLVPPEKRNPMLTTTYGTGQLIIAALDAGAREIVIGIGGSATVDGGCGCAQAIGVAFLDSKARPCTCGLAGGGLCDIADIDMTGRNPRVAEARIRVACDVTNPLTGPDGAARVYGPQKGATDEMVAQLDANLRHLAAIIRDKPGVDVEHLPGAGAAGGLGGGLVAFAGASLEHGATIVAEAIGLTGRLVGADLCITGEGRYDCQSASGKTAYTVAEIARDVGAAVICIPGQADGDAGEDMFADIRPLVAGEVTLADAMARPAQLLARRAAEAVRAFIGRK